MKGYHYSKAWRLYVSSLSLLPLLRVISLLVSAGSSKNHSQARISTLPIPPASSNQGKDCPTHPTLSWSNLAAPCAKIASGPWTMDNPSMLTGFLWVLLVEGIKEEICLLQWRLKTLLATFFPESFLWPTPLYPVGFTSVCHSLTSFPRFKPPHLYLTFGIYYSAPSYIISFFVDIFGRYILMTFQWNKLHCNRNATGVAWANEEWKWVTLRYLS
jgi:hypothetical protein